MELKRNLQPNHWNTMQIAALMQHSGANTPLSLPQRSSFTHSTTPSTQYYCGSSAMRQWHAHLLAPTPADCTHPRIGPSRLTPRHRCARKSHCACVIGTLVCQTDQSSATVTRVRTKNLNFPGCYLSQCWWHTYRTDGRTDTHKKINRREDFET